MSYDFRIQQKPNVQELKTFFQKVFADTCEGAIHAADLNQKLDEWYSVEEMIKYMPYGFLIEARYKSELIGAVFIAQQEPVTWPDGKKMAVYILGVDPRYRLKGIAKQLMHHAEKCARDYGGKSIVLNMHISRSDLYEFYLNLGYKKIGLLSGYYDNGDAVFFLKKLAA